MNCSVVKIDIEELNSTHILSQTRYWAKLKKKQGYQPSTFNVNVSKKLVYTSNNTGSLNEEMVVLLKRIDNNFCFAYVPYGPKIEPDFENQGVLLEEFSEALRPFLPRNCVFIRFDLIWENQWAKEDDFFDHEGNWLGPPSKKVQELRVNFSTKNWNLKKSSVDLLPKNTFFVNLKKSEQELLHDMRYNTRYSIRKAEKNGIRVAEYGLDFIDQWFKLYDDTAIRKRMPRQSVEYFKNVLIHQDKNKNGVKVKMLMADHDGDFLASMFLVLSSKRAVYLYGASSSHKKDLMASYALQWEAIKIAKKSNCTEYDMFGCAPNLKKNHPLHGVHLYKKGFGGKLFHRMGCWDYPLLQREYSLISI
ncbi:MAG: peptidoglycan bridge formation glycyltransferase FemA/FemB family protein [Candidatus Delongbacteria bacterium]|nr:peptidoglycan bridge formation glycyltransferase FemA/FemB family protein [Candidatus Delongbacteria bacterium]MBN2834332.1 peptidoglycan bridge formation glycyltransferase FemA/FemB family protein [Candidatus Delongbacteria bacterium]